MLNAEFMTRYDLREIILRWGVQWEFRSTHYVL